VNVRFISDFAHADDEDTESLDGDTDGTSGGFSCYFEDCVQLLEDLFVYFTHVNFIMLLK